MARKRIGPPHAHLDAPCTDACYEELTCPAGVPSDFDNDHAGVLRHDDGTFCGHLRGMSELGMRYAATLVGATGSGIDQRAALIVVRTLVGLGWRPPQVDYHDEETLQKVRAGLRSFDPFLDEEALTGIISSIQNKGILFRERRP